MSDRAHARPGAFLPERAGASIEIPPRGTYHSVVVPQRTPLRLHRAPRRSPILHNLMRHRPLLPGAPLEVLYFPRDLAANCLRMVRAAFDAEALRNAVRGPHISYLHLRGGRRAAFRVPRPPLPLSRGVWPDSGASSTVLARVRGDGARPSLFRQSDIKSPHRTSAPRRSLLAPAGEYDAVIVFKGEYSLRYIATSCDALSPAGPHPMRPRLARRGTESIVALARPQRALVIPRVPVLAVYLLGRAPETWGSDAEAAGSVAEAGSTVGGR
ncbi:hypothetical protein FB451DRAFT_1374629 [Mycena latifolia]|nr:hypothetical protein FB451DRAFT_1374629 [Mycena latifolia]